MDKFKPAKQYRGRFAPTPSGPLHLGSLFSAVASYLDAKSNHGKWLLRIDDIDPPREQAGASQAIIETLKAHSLHWDEDIIWQSKQNALYEKHLKTLLNSQQLFPCVCSRQQLQSHTSYPGFCRTKKIDETSPSEPFSLRINTHQANNIKFNDILQGEQNFCLSQYGGDFILRRKDQLYAYHLANVSDDAQQNITHIVRGIDLLESTAQHIFLQQALKLKTPEYLHLPVLLNSDGSKLSKQFSAAAIENKNAEKNLLTALAYLKQPKPPIQLSSCDAILNWATTHWNTQPLKGLKTIPIA